MDGTLRTRRWLTAKEAASDLRLGVSPVTVLRAVRRREIRALVIRHVIRVDPQSLERWILRAITSPDETAATETTSLT